MGLKGPFRGLLALYPKGHICCVLRSSTQGVISRDLALICVHKLIARDESDKRGNLLSMGTIGIFIQISAFSERLFLLNRRFADSVWRDISAIENNYK